MSGNQNHLGKIAEELFYPAYVFLMEIDWGSFAQALRVLYTNVFHDINEQSNYNELIKKFEQLLINSKITDYLEPMYARLPHIEEMLTAYPELRTAASSQITFISNLYTALNNFTIPIGSASDQASKIERFESLLLLLAKAKISSYANQKLLPQLAQNPSKMLVLSIGSGDNIAENLPEFALQAAQQEQLVTVYNYDYPNISIAAVVEDKIEQSGLQELVSVHYAGTYFPTSYATRTFLGGMNPEPCTTVLGCTYDPSVSQAKNFRQVQHPIISAHAQIIVQALDEIYAKYAETIIAKKQQDPDFKLVILYCCDSSFDPRLVGLARELVSRGFALGKDLELVHAYFQRSPACIYRDLDNIPEVNRILSMTNPDQVIPRNFDAQLGAYVFPNLSDMKLVCVPDPFKDMNPRLGA